MFHETKRTDLGISHMSNTDTVPAYSLREFMIKQGLEAEICGWRLTARAPRCFSIIRDEYGIKGRDKMAKYLKFCAILGVQPATFTVRPDGRLKKDWTTAPE